MTQVASIIAMIFKYLSNAFALTLKIPYFRSAKEVHFNVTHMHLLPRNRRDNVVNIFYYVAVLDLVIKETSVDNDRWEIQRIFY